MKSFQSIMVNAITGVIIGSIFLLPYLGWLYSGHEIIMLDWTKSFLIVGIAWGVACGITIGFVPIMINSSIAWRIIIGMIVGGFAGMLFYLIGDLAFLSKDSLSTILLKSLWGLGFGIIGGGICALVFGTLYRSLNWIRIGVAPNDENNQVIKRQFKDKILSALIGLDIGSFIGNFLLVLFGQAKIVMYGAIYFNEILLVYLLPIILGCFTAVYLYIRPLRKQLLQNILDGLRNGIIFGALFILYFTIVSFMVLFSSFPKPEFMNDNFWLEFVPGFIVVFTVLFGLFDGTTEAILEGFFLEWRAKRKTAV